MRRSRHVALLVLASAAALVVSYAGWTRIRSPAAAADANSYAVWIALLKGWEGDVTYLGSDETDSYFRIGRIFWSYYKVSSCAVRVPKMLSIHDDESYVVKLHVRPDNSIHADNVCLPSGGFPLGDLDRVLAQ
jgi:hypothetical protein